MKKNMKRLSAVVLGFLLLLGAAAFAQASADDVVHFEDPALEEAICGTIGNTEGTITIAQAQTVTLLNFGKVAEDSVTSLGAIDLFTSLEAISLNAQDIEDISPLAALPNLVSIELGDSRISDLEPLRGTHLRELFLYGNQIQDVSPLADIPELEVLVLAGNRVMDVSPLAGLTNLRVLILADNPIGDYTPLAPIYDQLEEKDFELTKTETIQFPDPVLEQRIRDCLGWPAGDITAASAQDIGVLDLHYEDGEQITDLSGLEYFTGVWLLSLYNNDITDISPLAAMPNLRDLDLGGNRVSDISALAGKDLVSLALWENEVSDIEPLRDAWNLEVLDLCNNRVTDISALAGKTKLTYLSLGGNGITDYSPVADFYDGIPEKDFDLDSEPIPLVEEENAGDVIAFTDPALEARVRQEIGVPDGDVTLEMAAIITGLDLHMPDGTPEEDKIQSIWDLLYFPNLEYLNFCNNCVGDISPLLELTNMQELRIAGNPIWDPSLLGEMTWLTRLEFYANMEEGVPYIVNLTNLVELNTGGVRSLPDDLYKLSNLEILRVAGGELVDISVLAQMPKLFALDASWNLIEDISALEGLPLTELYIAGNPIADYEPIRGVAYNLYGRDFDPDDFFAVMDEPEDPDLVITFSDVVFEQCVRDALGKPEGDITAADAATLTELWHNLEWTAPDEERIRDITGIQYFINLRKLGLSFNKVSDIGGLEGLTKLKELSLGSNQISDIGALAGMIDMGALSIFGNRISDIGALANMTNVYYLNANGNSFGDISPLAGMTGMDMLDLSNCKIRDITPLAGMTYLRVLGLSDNEISDIGVLAGKMNLQELRLENNPIADYSPIADIYPNLTVTDFEYWEGRSDALTAPEDPEQIVVFPDPLLETAVRDELGMPEGDLTAGDAARIRTLAFSNGWQEAIPEENKIKDLTGIETLINLQTLSLAFHGISDIGPLQNLTKLEMLDLEGNSIADLTALAGMTQLQSLRLSGNPIADYTPIETIYPNLKEKDFEYGQVFRERLIPDNPDEIIAFPDPVLEQKVRERIGKPEGDILWGDVAYVEDLYLKIEWQEEYPEGTQISDISGLEYFLNLKTLEMGHNLIRDLSPLAELEMLEVIGAMDQGLTDIGPLAGITSLKFLDLSYNRITDVSPLSGLTNLYGLFLTDNPILDYSCLADIYDNLTETDFDCDNASATVVVAFPDPVLEAKIRECIGRPEGDILSTELEYVDWLDLSGEWQEEYADGTRITDLTGMEYFVNLVSLELKNADIRDLNPLAGLEKLELLNLLHCGLEDISPLQNLTSLQWLAINVNQITDVSALAGLTNLYCLYLSDNPIEDLSPLDSIYPNLTEKDF